MTTYHATAERDERSWFLRVDDVGVTQARHLGEAEDMARDLVMCMLELPSDTPDVDVDIDIRLPSALRDRVDQALRTRAAVTEAAGRASTALRDAVWSLADGGLTARDIGFLVGVTRQRVQQLLAQREPPTSDGGMDATARRGATVRLVLAGQAAGGAGDDLASSGEAWDLVG